MARSAETEAQRPQALLQAGHATLARGDWEAAREAFAAAAEAEPSAEAHEGLGMACRWLGDSDAMFRSLQRAYRLHVGAGDRRGGARVAVQLALGDLYFHGDVAIARGWLERADGLLTTVEPGSEHGWLALMRGHIALQFDKDTDSARRQAAAALAIGRECGLVDVEMTALALEGLAMVSAGERDEGMRRLDQATAAAVAGELGELDAVSTTCCYLIDACKRVGDFERAAQWCEHVTHFCERWSDRLTFAACRTHYADVLIWRGWWAEAERELEANLGPLATIHEARMADGLVRLAELRRRQGRLEEADRLLHAAEGHLQAPLVRGALALDRGDPMAAAHAAERYLRRMPHEGHPERAIGLALLARARLADGDVESARGPVRELGAIADSVGTDAAHGSSSLAAGLLAAAEGEWEGARRAFEDAVDLLSRSGGRWETALARRELARALRALGRHDAAEREARAADTALRELGAATRDDAAAPRGLTRREVEVLRLIAQGRSNQDIASELFLSVRTVERHVANIYEKLGLSGRSARAAAASFALGAGFA